MHLLARIIKTAFAISFLVLTGCGANSAKKSYVLGEQLWNDGKFAAAVSEFDKVVAKDPTGKLGLLALQRSASTQALYLRQYSEAIRKFRRFADVSSNTEAAWEARKQIGEILFLKTEQYEQAILQYQQLVKARPDSPDRQEFLYRIAKSQFYLWQFDEAEAGFEALAEQTPHSIWTMKAQFEIGVTLFTRGEQSNGPHAQDAQSYRKAISAYEKFLKIYPKSNLAVEARFGIATCLEEMDHLDEAAQAYEALLATYPSPKVIRIKLIRIRERKTQRNH